MYFNPTFSCNGLNMTRVWHCFGNYMHKVDLTAILDMLDASKTNVLPINTNTLDENTQRNGLIIGFGGVRFDDLANVHNTDQMIIMLNINHQITCNDAVKKTLLAVELTNEKVIKLEVLNKDLKTSNNEQLIEAVKILNKLRSDLIIMPLLACKLEDAKKLIELGCPLLRIMGSGIGSGQGIIDPEEFQKICDLGTPVVLDGGVAKAQDFIQAVELGAEGCLVNSMLFGNGLPPAENLKRFMIDSQSTLKRFELNTTTI